MAQRGTGWGREGKSTTPEKNRRSRGTSLRMPDWMEWYDFVMIPLLLIAGILLLYDKIKKRVKGCNLLGTLLEYAMPLLFIIIGFLLLFHQAFALEIIFVVTGILTLIEGGILLVEVFENE